MSLTTIYELSQDAAFQHKVAASVAKQAMAVASANDQSTDQAKRISMFAKQVVSNLPYYNERVYILAATTLDTSSTDQAIDTAVANVLLSMVP